MYLKSIAVLVAFSFTFFSNGLSQSNESSDSSTFPEEIKLTWGVETNYLDEGKRFRSVLTFLNEDKAVLKESDWVLYFNFLGMIDPESLPPEVDLTHINGNLYKLVPTEQFEPILPGQQLSISFETSGSAIKETDAPSGFYFVYDDDQIAFVSDVNVEPFLTEEQVNRGPNDRLAVPTPALRYEENTALRQLPADSLGQIVPTPKEVKKKEGPFILDSSIHIRYEKGLETEALFLSETLGKLLGDKIAVEEGPSTSNAILLKLDSLNQDKSEAYKLSVDSQQIQITGTDPSGVFYGIQTLHSLVSPEFYQKAGNSIRLDGISVKDTPRFNYRGFHLDVARNFQSASAVKKLLDVMAFYKLNKFHFHLTDDEGWRLPIEELPELTEVGGRRGHTTTERDHMIPSYGSGPNPDPDISAGSGWYDRDTFIEILHYAARRHIEVIPEIDMPGHARAAIVSMKSRYARYMDEGKAEEANRFRLHDPEDQSQYRSVQNWDDNVINVCQPSTYRFFETVIDEIVEIYDEANVPLATVHFGGDEVPHGAWEKSPVCQDLIQRSADLSSVDDLPDYFFEQVRQMLAEHDLTMAGWEEMALDETDSGTEPDPDFAGFIRPYVWASVWGSGSEDHAYKLANAGYEVVMSHASNFYFDLAYSKDPEEPGFYWAGFVDTQDPYAFIPFDLYKNAEKNLLGNPISGEAFSNTEQLTDEGRDNIIGLQGQLWGEMLISQDRMEYMAMPHLFGLAERAWAQQPNWATIEDQDERKIQIAEDWNEFANRLGQHELPRMDYFHDGINYRVPPPGATLEDGLLKANVAYPGLTIRYTLDGSEPTANSKEYTGPVEIKGNPVIKVRTFSSDGRGSRTVTISR